MTGQKELYDIFELIYPVGIIIELATNANPKDLFGIGEWEQIKDRFILAAGDSYAVNSTGGSETTTLSTANMPAHTHTRGTMNITGELNYNNSYSGGNVSTTGMLGAFYSSSQPSKEYYLGSRSSGAGWGYIGFDASRTWTGETSSVGEGEAFSNMPPYYVAYLWRRVS